MKKLVLTMNITEYSTLSDAMASLSRAVGVLADHSDDVRDRSEIVEALCTLGSVEMELEGEIALLSWQEEEMVPTDSEPLQVEMGFETESDDGSGVFSTLPVPEWNPGDPRFDSFT